MGLYEFFPTKSRGDSLSHQHVNALSRVARKQGTPMVGSFTYSRENALTLPLPFVQRTLIVVEEADPGSSSSSSSSSDGLSNSAIVGVRYRFFDVVSGTWKTDFDDNVYEMDIGGIGINPEVDDILVGFWDPQRVAFIPTGPAPNEVKTIIKEGVLDTPLLPANSALEEPSTAVMSVYEKNDDGDMEDTGENITVTTRMTAHDTIVAGTWMVIAELNGENRPIAADCDVTILANASSSSSSSSSSSLSGSL